MSEVAFPERVWVLATAGLQCTYANLTSPTKPKTGSIEWGAIVIFYNAGVGEDSGVRSLPRDEKVPIDLLEDWVLSSHKHQSRSLRRLVSLPLYGCVQRKFHQWRRKKCAICDGLDL